MSAPSRVPVVLGPGVQRLAGDQVLLGGDPPRLLRLRAGSGAALDRMATGDHRDEPARRLGAVLVDRGLAFPRPGPAAVAELEVIVPVRDRPAELAECLQALGREHPVLVVDDASIRPQPVAEVCRHAGARVLRLPDNGGPAAARNAGLAATSAALVAFVDSDCVPPAGWIASLAGHLDDPRVGAIAPRVRGRVARGGLLASYARVRSPLDLGRAEARVRPGGRVPFVPTAALVVRRAALTGPAPFDAALRHGEDVDLVWRMHDAGWVVRYDPRTVVEHREPARWGAWLHRRFRYGTSAAPLAQRHGGRLSPVVLPPWQTTAWLLLLAGRPLPAAAAAAVPAGRLMGRLRRAGVPAATGVRVAVQVTGRGVLRTGEGLGGAGTVVTAPVLLALLAHRRSRRAAGLAVLAPPLLEWCALRPALDPVRWSALRLLDDLAYAAGVWRGCWSARSTAALRPRRAPPR